MAPIPPPRAATPAKIRLGYWDELMSMPLVAGIEGIVKSAVLRRAPLGELRQLLADGQLEGALLPTIDVLKSDDLSVVPCSTTSVMGASRFFLVLSKVLPTEITRVLADAEDFGAIELASVLFPKKMMIRPEFYRSQDPLDPAKVDLSADDGFDAYLLTGRHGFFIRKEAFAWTWDLTQAWYDYAQLPFPMLCWAVKKNSRIGTLDKELSDVAKRNEAGGNDFFAKIAERNGMTASGVTALYTRAVNTNFDHQVLTALRKYGQELTQARAANVYPLSILSIGTGTAVRK